MGFLWCDMDIGISDIWTKSFVPTFPDLLARDSLTRDMEKTYVKGFQVQCLQQFLSAAAMGWMSRNGS